MIIDLYPHAFQNVILVTEWSQNGLSATIVRRALARGQSVRYLVPDAVLEEIYARGLYGASRPSRPSFLLLVPPSTSAPETTSPPALVQTQKQVALPKTLLEPKSPKSAEDVEGECTQQLRHPTCVRVPLDSQHAKAGCDRVLGSRMQTDNCNVCGGDNSTCYAVSGNFQHNDALAPGAKPVGSSA
ncbi:unnamed protein product [Rodentolepis nana]|uniref:Zeta_toxin domain-containing protein n=1 Tax=Rodentolepis nana TaxID=102285 RepID=A0A0R3TCI0_RODNA|nr:unnamed protein product [Rodentolepis nana]